MYNIYEEEGSGYSIYEEEPKQEFIRAERSPVGDVFSTVYGGAIHGIGQAAKGMQVFTGYGKELEEWSDRRSQDPLALPDQSEFLGRDGAIKSFGLDVARTITESFVGSATGAAIGGLTGSPVGAAMGGVAGLITQFGGGTYADLLELGSKEGLSGDELHDYAYKGALWEVIPELGDQAVTVLSAGLLGGVFKSAKAGRKALKEGLKSGKLTPADFMGGLVKAEQELGSSAIRLGSAAFAGGASEVVTEVGQEWNREEYGLEGEGANKGYLFLLGSVASGGPASVGLAYTKSTQGKRQKDLSARIKENINSKVAGDSTANEIYTNLMKYDPDTANDWKLTYEDSRAQGLPIDLDQSFIDYYIKSADIQAKKLKDIAELERPKRRPAILQREKLLLDGKSSAEVLEKELKAVSLAKIEEEANVSFQELQAERTGSIIKKKVTAGISTIDKIVGEMTDTKVPYQEKKERGEIAKEAVDWSTVKPEDIEKEELETGLYDPEVPGERKGRPLESVMTTKEDISPQEYVPETVYDRTRNYWLADRTDREGWSEKQTDEGWIEVREPVSNFASALEVANDIEKTVLVEAASEVAEKEEKLKSTTDRKERSTLRKDINSIKKDIQEETDALTPEVTEGATILESADGMKENAKNMKRVVEQIGETRDRQVEKWRDKTQTILDESNLTEDQKTEALVEFDKADSKKIFTEGLKDITDQVEPTLVEKEDYVDERGYSFKVVTKHENGTIEQETKKGAKKPFANKWITNITGHEAVTYKTKSEAIAALDAGKPIGKPSVYKGTGTTSKQARAEKLGKLSEEDIAIRDYLLEELEIKMSPDNIEALSNQMLLNKGKEGVKLEDYTKEQVMKDAANIKRKRDKEDSEQAKASEEGQAGSGINLSALEEDGGRKIEKAVEDLEDDGGASEALDVREGSISSMDTISDTEAQRIESGSETDVQEEIGGEDAEEGGGQQVSTPLTQYEKGTAIRFIKPKKAKDKTVLVSTGLDEEFSIHTEEKIGTIEHNGKEYPSKTATYIVIDDLGNVVGEFGNQEEAAAFKGGTVGQKPMYPYEPKNLLEERDELSRQDNQTIADSTEEITGIELLMRAMANSSPATKSLAKALLTNMVSRNKLENTKVYVGGSGKTYTVAGEDIFMSHTADGLNNLHEAVHALTVREMKSNAKVKAEVVKLMKLARVAAVEQGILSKEEMKEVAKDNKAYVNNDIYARDGRAHAIAYALRNEREFLAQSFSSQQVRTFLDSVELPAEMQKGKLKTFWDAFVNIIGNALGLSPKNHTALHEVLSLTYGLATTEIGQDVDVESTRDYAPTYAEVKDTVEKTSEVVKDTFKDVAKRYILSISDRLMEIDPNLSYKLSKMDSSIARRVAKTMYEGNAWEDQAKEKFSTEELQHFEYLLKKASQNSIVEAKEMAANAGVDMQEIWKALDELKMDMFNTDLLSKKKMDGEYFPRIVTDMDGLHDYYDKKGMLPVIKKMLRDRGLEDTDENIKTVMSDTLGKGGYPALLGKPGSAKARTVRHFEEEMAPFYASPFDAFRRATEDMAISVEQHKLTGKSRRLSLEKIIDGLEDDIDKGIGNESEKQALINATLKDLEGSMVINEEGIGRLITDIPQENQKEVRDMLFARFNERGMSENMRMVKHATLAMTLLNPTTAIKQIADVGIAISEKGLRNAINGVKAALGDKADKFNLYEMGIQQYIMEHGEKQDKTSQWLDKGFGISGFKMMDAFGKQVSYQSSMKELQGQSKEQFLKEYEGLDIEDKEGLYDKIQAGLVEDQDVQDFMTWKVAELQPLFLSQMSEKMLTAGNARVFGMLLQYSMRRLGMIKTHFGKVKEEEGLFQASKYIMKVITVLTAAEFTAECIAGLILGKPCNDISEQLEKTTLGLMMLDRFTLDSALEGNIVKSALSLSGANAIESADTIFKSSLTLFGEEDFDWKMLKNLPMGKIPFSWVTEEGMKAREEAWSTVGEYKSIFAREE